MVRRPGLYVHGFEPNPALWPRVEEKAAAEGLSGSITLHKTAMGAADETLSFFIPDGPNQGTGSFAQAPYNWEGEKTEFEVRNASALLEELGIDDVDLVKIDVEGFELEVMTGLKAFLQKCRPVVWVEVGAADADRRLDTETLKGFLGGDYRLYRSMPVSPFLTSRKFAEFSEIPDDMLVNVIAVPKN